MTVSSFWPLALASIENFVLINTVLSILVFVIVVVVRRSNFIRSLHPASLSRFYSAAIILPPIASAWLVTASLLPALWLGAAGWSEEHRAPHELHLLNALTAAFNPALSYAAALFALMTAVVAVYTAGSAFFRIGNVVRRLEIGSEPTAPERIEQVRETCRKYNIDVGLVVSSYPFSLIWGYLRSKLIVSTGLLNALTEEELAGLLEHEAAHHRRRDNISKWLLTICRYSSLAFPLADFLYRRRNAQIELLCDEIAARRTNAPVEIASALVKLKRFSQALPPQTARLGESGFFGEDNGDFERRVTRLLALTDGKSVTDDSIALTRSWARSASIMIALFVFSLALLFASSPLAVHRVLEAALRIF